jgi:hypothetical protein
METYLKTQEATIKAAEQAMSENFQTYIKKGRFLCDCGESFACYLIDENTLNTLEIFVYCEACHNQYCN